MSEEAHDTSDGVDIQTLTGLFDAPAYVRRARNVEQALEHILARAHAVRGEWAGMARLRIGVLHALAGDWLALRPWLADDAQLGVLQSLHAMLSPKLRLPPEPTRSPRVLRQALHELLASIERFNARWQDYVQKISLDEVNELREGYNRYYVLEKACSMRSDVLARIGFQPLPPLGLDDLKQLLPPLPMPKALL